MYSPFFKHNLKWGRISSKFLGFFSCKLCRIGYKIYRDNTL